MKKQIKTALHLFTLSTFLLGACANSHGNLKDSERVTGSNVELPIDDLGKDGLVLEVHAAVHDYRQYVGTLRQKGNFFIAEQFPLVPASPNLMADFLKLRRHDKIKVKGVLVNPRNPQRHIRVTSLEIVKAYETELPHHEYEIRLPEDLKASGKIRGLVHAVAAEGSVLLIDYRGAVIPVVARNPALTKKLYRNDSIEIAYTLAEHPAKPPHLLLNTAAKPPLRVLYSIASENQKDGERQGYLVLFPKSPQVQFNVFALEASNKLGLKHNYTLVNFENEEVFRQIREKLQSVWDSAPQDKIYNARNRLLNPRVLVRAKGKLNVVDPGQANPQIMLKSVDDLEFLIDTKP